MALRGTKKALAVEHEVFVARKYRGHRSESSGAADHDQGDVRTQFELIECKGKFGERVGGKPVRSTLIKEFEKIADEAWAESREPVMALRFYMPNSPLAVNGWVDLTVRLLKDDVELVDQAAIGDYIWQSS